MDFNKLWQNFTDTLQNHYVDFAGRVGRAQFWYFILVCVVVEVLAAIMDGILASPLVSAIVGLALLLPMTGMAVRRVQDTGRNGQIVWIWAIVAAVFNIVALLAALGGPFGVLGFLYFSFVFGRLISLAMLIVSIAIIYFCAQPGQPGDNAYGPPPPQFNPAPAPA